jgi:hypothetical protein
MAIIINEMEVVVEAPPAAGAESQPAGTAAPPPTAPPALSPDDIDAIVRWQAERLSRVYAG